MKTTRLTCYSLAVAFASITASSYADDRAQTLQSITTKNQASALKPGSKVVMTCAKCKTVQIAEVDKKRGVLGWFQPKTKHLCPGCGGRIEVTNLSVKGIQPERYIHTCSKCGSKSVFCCGTEGGKM